MTVGEFEFRHGQVVQCRDSSVETCRRSEKVDKLLKCSGEGDTRAESEHRIQGLNKNKRIGQDGSCAHRLPFLKSPELE